MMHTFDLQRDIRISLLDKKRRLNERPTLAPISATFIRTKNIPRCFVTKLRSSYRGGQTNNLLNLSRTGPQIQSFQDEINKTILKESEPVVFSFEWLLIVIQMLTVSLVLFFVLRIFAC